MMLALMQLRLSCDKDIPFHRLKIYLSLHGVMAIKTELAGIKKRFVQRICLRRVVPLPSTCC